MAKKPMTKGQIVSHFAGKSEVSKKTASVKEGTLVPRQVINEIFGILQREGFGKLL